MSDQITKKTGALWCQIVEQIDENIEINQTAAFVSVLHAQLSKIESDGRRYTNDDEKKKLNKNLNTLVTLQKRVQNLSLRRDTERANRRYSANMTSIYSIVDEALKIGVYYNLIDFEDGTRFGSYSKETGK